MKPAVGYVRVSKEREDGVSPSTQLSKIRQHCELHDLHLVDVYRDLDLSGTRMDKRVGLQDMLRRIEGGDIRFVVCYKHDRLARSVSDFHKLLSHFETYGCNLISVTQHLDTSSPIGTLLRNMLVDFAQFESEMIGQRIFDNLQHIVASKGKYVGGSPPFGYRLSKKGLVVDEEQARLIRWLFDAYLEGNGTRALSRLLKEKGVSTPSGNGHWGFSTIRSILRNPVYTGRVRYAGKEYEGNHDPVISERVFARAQEMIRLNDLGFHRPKGDIPERILTGLVRCGVCGRSANIKHANGGKVRYQCSSRNHQQRDRCTSILLDEPSLVAAVRSAVFSVHSISPERVKEDFDQEKSDPDPEPDERALLEKRIEQIKRLTARLFDDHYEHGVITRDQFAETNARYLKEREEAQERLRDLGSPTDDKSLTEDQTRMIRESMDVLKESWDHMTASERALAIRYAVREITWNEDRATIVWQIGKEEELKYHAVRRGTAYFDERWMHVCPKCGKKTSTPTGLASHKRKCFEAR